MTAQYTKTGLFVNGGSPGISAAFLNNIETYLTRTSGQTATGKYWLAGNGGTGSYISLYIQLPYGVTPVSVSIDTADNAPTGSLGTPTAGHLTAYGFQIYASFSATSGLGQCAGNWTVTY